MTAERAEPRKERRLAAPGPGLPNGEHERGLRDVLGGVREPDARRGEAIQARVVGVEELVERAFITAAHAPDQVAILRNVHVPWVYGIRGVWRGRSFAVNSQLPNPNSQCIELARCFGSWELGIGSYVRSTASATPLPPPRHSVAMPRLRPRCLSA